MRTLHAQVITPDGFAPYGWVAQSQGRTGRPINGGSSLRIDEGMGELSLTAAQGRPCLTLFRAQAQDPRGPWRELERHRLGTQTFVPLGGARCLVLVALGEQAPDPATLAAFVVSGDQAVTLREGTWHHGLISLQDADFLVIERMAALADCELSTLEQPVCVAGAS